MVNPSKFSRVWAVLSTCMAIGVTSMLNAAPAPKPETGGSGKRILILGGTRFLGPALVEAAQKRSHQVTLFNRGRTRPELFPNVEKLQGDRDPNKGEGLKALEGRTWDAVIDTSGYYPRMVSASARILAPNVKQYIFISSISAYQEPNPENGDENAPLATLPDSKVETMGKNGEFYGGLKALCEKAAEEAMPGRTTIIRPGYIVGPDDDSGRFAYWPVRFSRGGEILVPGKRKDPIQVIDVRDLAEWLVKLVETGETGTFNACGPAKRLEWGKLLDACQKAGGVKSRLTFVPTAFLAKESLAFPIWEAYEGATKGFHTWKNDRALKAGLKFRPIETTVKDTLAWYRTQEDQEKGRKRLAGPDAEAEAKALAAWKAEKGKGSAQAAEKTQR